MILRLICFKNCNGFTVLFLFCLFRLFSTSNSLCTLTSLLLLVVGHAVKEKVNKKYPSQTIVKRGWKWVKKNLKSNAKGPTLHSGKSLAFFNRLNVSLKMNKSYLFTTTQFLVCFGNKKKTFLKDTFYRISVISNFSKMCT